MEYSACVGNQLDAMESGLYMTPVAILHLLEGAEGEYEILSMGLNGIFHICGFLPVREAFF